MVLLVIIPIKWLAIIGNINPTFSVTHLYQTSDSSYLGNLGQGGEHSHNNHLAVVFRIKHGALDSDRE